MDYDFPGNLLVGTSSWSCADWAGSFYPPELKPAEFITEYANHFPTVEIDATFYRAPSASTVEAWERRTPPGFIFSAKVPQSITHEKYLVDCKDDVNGFAGLMSRLGDKLGPLVFQFAYVAKGKDADEYHTGSDFLSRLKKFLPTLPSGFQYVVEVRNGHWLGPELAELLAKHKITLAFADIYTMPGPPNYLQLAEQLKPEFFYVRFLGNHKQMDNLVAKLIEDGKREKSWESVAVDRTREMQSWAPAIRELLSRQRPVYAYFNNHYAGNAIGSIRLFYEVWKKSVS